VIGLAVVALLLAGGNSALATTGHTFVGQFGGLGNGDGQFGGYIGNGPGGIAVMPSTGDVYTVDEAQTNQPVSSPRVQRFNSNGVFVSAFATDPSYQGGFSALAVDSSGAVYAATGFNGGVPSVVKYTAAGVVDYVLDASGSGTMIRANPQVAVDPVDGTVYVTATDSNALPVVDRFDAAGNFLDFFDGSDSSVDGGFQCVGSLAVDGSHRIYVLDACPALGVGKYRVDRYGSGGEFQVTVDDGISRGTPRSVAVDPLSGEVYVADDAGLFGLQITHFSAGGASAIYTFDASDVGSDVAGVRGMAVSGAGTVYTSDDSRPFVQRFARFDGPTVLTGSGSSLEARSVVLEGTIDPEGVASSYHFEYGTGPTFGSRTPDFAVGSGNVAVPASAPVTGLSPNTIYNFRIVGSNDSGSIVGTSGTFTTATAPPVVDPLGPPFASEITPRSVRLHGSVNASNSFGQWHFEYGTTTAYGTAGPEGPDQFMFVGTDQAVKQDFSGLQPGTTYHFRLVAHDLAGGAPVFGSDQTFVTAPAAGGGATGVTTGRATLTGTINPRGVVTTYHFNYGPTASYGSSTAEVDGGSGDGDQPVSEEISGLLPGRTYHVQVVATSADGVIRSGGDGLFRTAPAPTAEVVGPTGISTDAATVAGDVDTFGLPGSYHFDVWSLDSSYKRSTAERPAAGYASAERVSAALTGLPAGETFAVQLTVSSNDSVSVSDLATFATAQMPRIFPTPPASDNTSVYGCGTPRLDAYGLKPKPGDTITISGRDLGVGGSVVLGERALKPADWTAHGFKVVVPQDASGSLALTVNCGHPSNTIAVAIFQEPDNAFSIARRSASGSTATLKVRVPGPGKLESAGAGTRATTVTVKQPGTTTLKIKLTNAGVRALSTAASHSRTVKARVRFTPAGGRSASKTVTITFKRKGGR
jgi:hypothetical protein